MPGANERNTRFVRLLSLGKVQDRLCLNNEFASILARFLEEAPLPSPGDLAGGGTSTEGYRRFFLCWCRSCGIESETLGEDSVYLDCFREIPPSLVVDNPYIRTVKFPHIDKGGWRTTSLGTSPFEAFICDDLAVRDDFIEIPQVGFCSEELSYPAILQDDREWMAVKPSEICSMAPHIGKVQGRVAVLGLGLGYFPFMATLRKEVSEVVIVEKDPTAISIFTEYLLPQFPGRDKIRVVQGDAFDWLEGYRREGSPHFDYVFVDLWHDAQDGVLPYARARSLEAEGTTYLYWVEEFLQSAIRWKLAWRVQT